MTHKPPVPDAATPPWPATPVRHLADVGSADVGSAAGEARDEDPERVGGRDKRIVAGVAGIAVGSAAIAAALLFSGRLNRPKSASAPVPPQRTPESLPDEPAEATHAGHGDAADIHVD